MIVYREQRRRVPTGEALRRVEEASGLDRLIEWGMVQAGIADEVFAEADGERAGQEAYPTHITISVPEGFAYFALHPDLYRMAARRFAGEQHPARVAIIGIRSIGLPLGAVVEEELQRLGCRTAFWTVRPRGHPWDRKLAITDELARRWRQWDGWFGIVDEGPGLSGSSFGCVSAFLAGLGIADERIVLFPSWRASGENFVSAAARERWQRHRKYTAEFEELGLFPDARDLSAGRWRALCRIWPAAHPQHERRKYRRGDRLYKFAGYGRFGAEKLERARVLNGFLPEVCGLEEGFLATRWLRGRQPGTQGAPGTALLEHAARYLATVRREFTTGEAADSAALAEMMALNTGREWSGELPEAPAVALDARMFRHEWLETADDVFQKTDALDHADDPFFPGPQDIAWDLAGFSIEFELDPCAEAHLLACYARHSGDRAAAARLPFYRRAYLAARLGYCDLAAQSLGDSEDAARFRRARGRYAGVLDGR